MTPQSSSSTRVAELQSLRGVMAIIVVVSHCSLVYELPLNLRLGIDAIVNPHAAVIFFFVLSGYVLQASLARGQATLATAAVFYVRRFLRLVPLVSIVTALAVIVTYSVGDMSTGSAWLDLNLGPAQRATPTQIGLAFVGLSAVMVPTVWTIIVEAIGSLYMPVHNWVRTYVRHGEAFVGLALLTLTIGISLTQSDSLWRFTFYFALGAGLQSSRHRWLPVLSSRPSLGAPLAAAAAFLLFGSRTLWFLAFDQQLAPVVVDYFNLWRGLLEGLFASILIASVVATSGGVGWLRNRRATSTGDLSFGIYLFHFPVMTAVAWALYRLFGVDGGSPLTDMSLLLGLTLVIVYPLSALAYRYVERPGILAGRALLPASGTIKVPAEAS